MRITLLNVPAGDDDEAVLVAILAMALVFGVGGLARLRVAHQFNGAHAAEARTSPIKGHFFCQPRRAVQNACRWRWNARAKPSFSMVSMAASAAAQEAGWPQ